MRVVVVGHGMVGSRFVGELLARGGDRFQVLVLGQEEHEPYNRVLLGEVVSGAVGVTDLALLAARHPLLDVRPGTAAVAVDRGAGEVVDATGARHPFDLLVLATGAEARVPQGFSVGAGVHVLRDLDDARGLVAATATARSAVVVGGGVLGLEAARGLRERGLAVTVVHRGPHLLDRQLDAAAGETLAGRADDVGIAVRTGASPEGVVRDGAGALRGVSLAGGEVLPADLVLLACGTVPRDHLAADAGLPTDRGVLVGAELRSPADPRVAAIGDCARDERGCTGLVADGWEQAEALARSLARAAPGAAGPAGASSAVALLPGQSRREPDVARRPVMTVKAPGLDTVVMGRAALPGERAVRLSDPLARRHVEVVVAGGVLVGATCIGAPDVAPDLLAAYDRGTPLPVDPAHLLLRPLPGTGPAPASSPTLMPEHATVCRCNGVSKGQLVRAWEQGACDVGSVAAATRATTGCGSCTEAVCGVLEWLRASDGGPAPTADADDGTAREHVRRPVPAP